MTVNALVVPADDPVPVALVAANWEGHPGPRENTGEPNSRTCRAGRSGHGQHGRSLIGCRTSN